MQYAKIIKNSRNIYIEICSSSQLLSGPFRLHGELKMNSALWSGLPWLRWGSSFACNPFHLWLIEKLTSFSQVVGLFLGLPGEQSSRDSLAETFAYHEHFLVNLLWHLVVVGLLGGRRTYAVYRRAPNELKSSVHYESHRYPTLWQLLNCISIAIFPAINGENFSQILTLNKCQRSG